MKNKIKCRFCGSESYTKQGYRKTKNKGKVQKYKCLDCGKYFTYDDGFFRMRNHPKKITCAIDLFYQGVSTRKVQEHFQAFYPENSSHKSIYKWIVKYSKLISHFTDNLQLQIGKELQVDEMEYHRRKYYNKKGVEKKKIYPNPIPIRLGLINKINPSKIIIKPPMNFIICICLLLICFPLNV